jgi:hypothetical protein
MIGYYQVARRSFGAPGQIPLITKEEKYQGNKSSFLENKTVEKDIVNHYI